MEEKPAYVRPEPDGVLAEDAVRGLAGPIFTEVPRR
jgi:hypothetical protein